MNYFKQIGFSLIELMIVVAIIGILSAIAIPSYQGYTRKARFSEVIAATEPFKTAVSLALQEGIPPSELTSGAYGIPEFSSPTHSLQDIQVERGIITATATKLINNLTYILIPNTDGSHWEISGSCLTAEICET